MEQVELLDDALQEPAPEAPPRPRRWWPAVVVGGLALALVGTQAALSARDHAELARVAALPGVLPSVGPDVAELWRVDEADVGLLSSGAEVAGGLVGVRTGPGGDQSVTSLDPATGAVRWTVTLTDPDPVLAVRGARASTTACAPVPAAPTQVACLVTDVVLSLGGAGRLTYSRPPSQSRVVVVDAADGRVVADHATSPALDFAVLPGLVVVASPAPDGHAEVTAQDLTTGAVRWRYTSSRPQVDPAGDVSGFGLLALDDLVGVVEAGAQVTLLASDGAVERGRARYDRLSHDEAATRIELLAGYGTNQVATTIVRPDRADVVIAGRLVHRAVDDGSLPGIELTEGSRMQARDASTGALLWTADTHTSGPVLVLHGLVYCTSGESPGGLVAFDGRSGTAAWTASAGTYDQLARLMTDGQVLLVGLTPLDGTSAGTLAAFALADGRPLWQVPLPDGLNAAWTQGRLLVASSGGPTAVLGAP